MDTPELSPTQQALADGVTTIVDMDKGSDTPVDSGEDVSPVKKLGPRKSLKEEFEELSIKAIGEEKQLREAEEADEEIPAKKLKNPQARARRLEKERSELTQALQERDRRLEDLQIQISRMSQAMQERIAQEQQYYAANPDDEPVDPELDPIGAVGYDIKQLHAEIAALKQELSQSSVVAQRDAQLKQANQIIVQTAQQAGPEYARAMDHLAAQVFDHANKTLPHLTSFERRQAVESWLNEQKAAWVSNNINPAQELYEMAVSMGYEPGSGMQQQEQVQQSPAVDRNRESIRQARQKTQNTNSMGGIQGVAPQTFNASTFMGMDGSEFNRTVDNLIASKKVPAGRNIGRTPSLKDLLPGKAIKV